MGSPEAVQPRTRRRSQRVKLAVPLFVSSRNPDHKFDYGCETFSVNSHGGEIRLPFALEAGASLRLDIPHSDRSAIAHVVRSERVGSLWETAFELDKEVDFWGIKFPAGDRPSVIISPEEPVPAPTAAVAAATAAPAPAAVDTALQPATPGPLPAPAPPQVATPPAAEVELQPLEQLLRKKADGIFGEFEQSYRQSLGDLLVRLRADLEQKASADWERYRTEAQKGLQEIAAQVRQQMDEELGRWRREGATAERQLQSLREVQARVEAWLASAGKSTQEQIAQQDAQSLRTTREEVERLLAKVPLKAQEEMQRLAEITSGVEKQLAAVHQARDYIESVIRTLSQTVNRSVRENVAATLEPMRGRIAEDFAAQREKQMEQLEQHLLNLANQVGADLRQKLFEDFDRHEREFLDRIQVRVEEARTIEANMRQYADQMSSELGRKSEQLFTELRNQLNDQIAHHQGELNSRLEQKSQELIQRTQDSLRNFEEQVWGSLKQRLQTDFDQRHQELQGILETTEIQTARLEARAEKLAARLDVELEAHLAEASSDTVARTRAQLEQVAKTVEQNHLAAVQEQLKQLLAPMVNRSEAAAHDLHQMLDSLKNARTQLESQTLGYRREMEQVRAWFTQETQQFHRLVHDTLVEASGQIKGRVHLAAEMAQGSIQRYAQDTRAQLEALLTSKSEEFKQGLEKAHQQLTRWETEKQSAVDWMFEAHLTEVSERLQRQADELTRKSAAQLQAHLADTIESITRLLREKLGPQS